MSRMAQLDHSTLRKMVRGMRGDRLRALIDAARDVARGSHDREVEALAKDVVQVLRLEGHVV